MHLINELDNLGRCSEFDPIIVKNFQGHSEFFLSETQENGLKTFSGRNCPVFSDIKISFGTSLDNNWINKSTSF